MNATNMRCVAHRNHLFTMESEVINSYMRVKTVADAARQGLTYNALQALNATENAFNVSGVDGILAHSDWLIESFGDPKLGNIGRDALEHFDHCVKAYRRACQH